MIPPTEAAHRLLWAALIGAALGMVYDLLRPLRKRCCALSDLLFVAAMLYGWVYLSFGVCGGDVRFGCTVGMGVGGAAWMWLPGRLFRPVYAKFTAFCGRICALFLRPVKIFFKKIEKNFIFLLAFLKKWFTIRQKRDRMHSTIGGKQHGTQTHKDPTEAQTFRTHHESRAAGRRRDVHHRAAGAARLDP